MIEHHNWNGYLNGKKELFDLKQNIEKVYGDIFLWNQYWDKKKNHSNIKVKNKLYYEIAKNNNTMIWFPHESFFNFYLPGARSIYVEHTGHFGSIGKDKDLDTINTHGSKKLKELITNTKGIIFNKFWYAFASLKNIVKEVKKNKDHQLFGIAEKCTQTNFYGKGNVKGRRLCENVESKTKELLSHKLNIHTYATSGSSYGDFKIDLTKIKDDLVNMTGKPFPLTS